LTIPRETWFWAKNSAEGEPDVRFFPVAFSAGNAVLHVQVVRQTHIYHEGAHVPQLLILDDLHFPIPSEDYLLAGAVESCGDAEKASSLAYSLLFKHVLLKHYRSGGPCDLERHVPRWWKFYMDYLRNEDERRVKDVMER